MIVSTLQISFLSFNRNEKEFHLFIFSFSAPLPPCPIFSRFCPLIVNLTERAGELSREKGEERIMQTGRLLFARNS